VVVQNTEELWQAYNAQGEATGPLTKAAARSGLLHAASHVWIWRSAQGSQDGIEILLQKRGQKPTWPGFLDISAAGHIDFGETPLVAAIREIQEEIGLSIDANELQLQFVHRAYMTAGNGVIENEFQWVYLYNLSAQADLTYADGEVASTRWLSVDDFKTLIRGDLASDNIVPHGEVYFASLLASLAAQEPA
jgi:isopentenyl-diphosphate Delta-isomerase